MAVDLHMEASGTSKNSDFVKDILKKRQSAKIVIEVAVKAPKWPAPKIPELPGAREGCPKNGKRPPQEHQKRPSFPPTCTLAFKALRIREKAPHEWLRTTTSNPVGEAKT